MSRPELSRALLARLATLGARRFYANPGTEFVGLIEAFAAARAEAWAAPDPVLVADEALGVHAAAGAALVTGQAEVVMVHTGVGLASASIGLLCASRNNLPLIFISGLTSPSEQGRRGARDRFIHWAQDQRDQGGMVREFMKWEARISHPGHALDLLDRAWAIAHSPPMGPVHLLIDRDTLLMEAPEPGPLQPAAEWPPPDPAALAELAGAIARARLPLAISTRLGQRPGAARRLGQALQRLQLGLLCPQAQAVEAPESSGMSLGAEMGLLQEADLVLVLDTDVPWLPFGAAPRPGVPIIELGWDPQHSAIPQRSYPATRRLALDPLLALEALALGPALPPRPALHRLLQAREARQEAQRAALRPEQPLSPLRVALCLAELRGGAPFTVVNELSLPQELLPAEEPGQSWRTGSASGLGWGLGAALGLCLAEPERRVIAALGDGAAHLGNPTAALELCLRRGLDPILLILDNRGYASIRRAALDFYPSGHAAAGPAPLCGLAAFDWAALAGAVGGRSWRVHSVGALRAALAEALSQRGRVGLIHAHLEGALG